MATRPTSGKRTNKSKPAGKSAGKPAGARTSRPGGGAAARRTPANRRPREGAAEARVPRERQPRSELPAGAALNLPEARNEGPSGEYRLLDSGNQQKLERIGPYLLVRPSPQALWSPRLAPTEWEKADGVFVRDSDGGGQWEWQSRVKREFDIVYSGLSLQLKLTNFGHMGLFPEQADNWEWMRRTVRERLASTSDRNLHVLNLFGYTGGSTLACSQAGAHVVHLDAAKGVVDWARSNARASSLHERPVRWIVDDAMKFLKREERRGGKYQAIVLDPPSFGRGPQGEVFKIEDDIIPLLEACRSVLAHNALFVLYSCHTPGFTPLTMQNQLQEMMGANGVFEAGEMSVREAGGRPLPSGTWARWFAGS